MVDFVVKFTAKEDEDEGIAPWVIWTDGSSNQHVVGVRFVLQLPKGDLIERTVCLQFLMTNNKAVYDAILTGLNLAKAAGALSVVIHSDSQVIVRHINGDYKAKEEWMKEYLSMVRVSQEFLAKFVQIPREENEQADRLTKAAFVEHTVIDGQVLSFI